MLSLSQSIICQRRWQLHCHCSCHPVKRWLSVFFSAACGKQVCFPWQSSPNATWTKARGNVPSAFPSKPPECCCCLLSDAEADRLITRGSLFCPRSPATGSPVARIAGPSKHRAGDWTWSWDSAKPPSGLIVCVMPPNRSCFLLGGLSLQESQHYSLICNWD